MRALTVIALLLAAAQARAEGRVVLFSAVGTPQRVHLAGRVLEHARSGGSSVVAKNLRRLTAGDWEGADVEVRFEGRAARTVSGHDGVFAVDLEAPEGHPFPVGLRTAEARAPGALPGVAAVDVLDPRAPFFVVSDFDDTLAVTNATHARGVFNNALLKDEATQPAVEGMAAFYGCLRAGKAARPAFALVSGSPEQYAGRVTRFLALHGFPPFGLYLRNVGLKTLHDYKQPVLRRRLAAVPGPVVLVGDSGEHDPEVYAQIRAEFPERVKAIYIRDAGKAADPARFAGMVLFHAPAEAARDAVGRGLADAACVARAFAPPDAGRPGR